MRLGTRRLMKGLKRERNYRKRKYGQSRESIAGAHREFQFMASTKESAGKKRLRESMKKLGRKK